jgi:hypothetical protein
MRLERPTFHQNYHFPVDPGNEVAKSLAKSLSLSSGEESTEMPVGCYLMAPQAAGLFFVTLKSKFYKIVPLFRQLISF